MNIASLIDEGPGTLLVSTDTGQYTQLKVRRTGHYYWGQETQSIYRTVVPEMERFLMLAIPDAQARQTRFQLDIRAQTPSSQLLPYGEHRVPAGEVRKLQLALEAMAAKAGSPDEEMTTDAVTALKDFRLPDPRMNPELYRLWGSAYNRRLTIAWGCEKPASTSLPAAEVIPLLLTESDYRGWFLLARRAAAVLLLVFLLLFGLGTLANFWLGPPVTLSTTPALRCRVEGSEVVELRSRFAKWATSPALLTARNIAGKTDFGLPVDGSHVAILPAGVWHLTGSFPAGDYRFVGPSGKAIPLPLRDLRGAAQPTLRASMVIDRERLATERTIFVSLAPSISEKEIARFEVGWARDGAPNTLVDISEQERAGAGKEIHLPADGRYTVVGLVTDRDGLADFVQETVLVGSAPPAEPYFAPAAVFLHSDQDSLLLASPPAGIRVGGREMPMEPRHPSSPALCVFRADQDAFVEISGSRSCLRTNLKLSDVSGAFQNDDFIAGHGRLFRSQLTWYSPLTPEGDALQIVSVLSPVTFADKSGQILRAVVPSQEPFTTVTWHCTGPGGKVLERADEAEVLFLAVDGDYEITVSAKTLSGRMLRAVARLPCRTPHTLTLAEKILRWSAKFSFYTP